MQFKKLLIIKHVQHNNLGVIVPICERLGLEIDLRTPALGDEVPEYLQEYAGLMILGSQDSVYDNKPYIRTDLDLIGKAEQAGVPYLGICLGAQLLAHYIGGNVHKGILGPMRKFGPVVVKTDDAVFGDELVGSTVFQWHQDTFTLPETATILATDGGYPLQAFRWGENFYGVQFHPEVDNQVITRWVQRDDPNAPLHQILDEAEKHLPSVHGWLEVFIKRLFISV